MNNGEIAATVVAAVLLAMVAAAALGSTSTETSTTPSVTVPDPQDLGPTDTVIVNKRESGGTSILGVRFGTRTYRVGIQFYDKPGCSEAVMSSESWPAVSEACSNRVAVVGAISAIGVAATGESIIGVEIEVSAECYDAATPGEFWPPPEARCSQAHGG